MNLHPGEILKELYMDPYSIDESQMANIMGLDLDKFKNFLKAKENLTLKEARILAKHFQTTVDFWMNIQINWMGNKQTKGTKK